MVCVLWCVLCGVCCVVCGVCCVLCGVCGVCCVLIERSVSERVSQQTGVNLNNQRDTTGINVDGNRLELHMNARRQTVRSLSVDVNDLMTGTVTES